MEFFEQQKRNALEKDDRRKRDRFQSSGDFTVFFKKGFFFKKIGQGFGRDLSEIGVGFTSKSLFRINQQLSLRLVLSPEFTGRHHLRVIVRVARSIKMENSGCFLVGCEFVNIPQEYGETIRQFVWWLSLKTSSPSK